VAGGWCITGKVGSRTIKPEAAGVMLSETGDSVNWPGSQHLAPPKPANAGEGSEPTALVRGK
jgi:hypothetical protein